ncbi:MAG: hypothetical protein WC784_03585 [Candidatus Shapirobacteria bacterium]
MEDRNIIRERYGLWPEEKLKNESPAELEKWVEGRLKKVGYRLRPGLERQKYFDENDVMAVTNIENKVVYQSLRKDGDSKKIMLEHELIHVLQGENTPIEGREYEAYIGTVNKSILEEMIREGSLNILFMIMARNIRNYYKEAGEVAPWDKIE